MFPYECEDQAASDPMSRYSIEVFNTILDTVISSIFSRFKKHGTLSPDLSCLDPKNFNQLTELPDTAFDKLATFWKNSAMKFPRIL